MNLPSSKIVLFVSLGLAVAAASVAQERAAGVGPVDRRVGLRPGFLDAGEAAWNMEIVANHPRPDGFFDPEAPAGVPLPSEAEREAQATAAPTPEAAPAPTPAPAPRRAASILGFANTDLAFRDHHLFLGSYYGFNVYDIEDPQAIQRAISVICPGGQGDVSVHGNLLFMSVEETRGRLDCGTQGVEEPVSAERFRGIRIFDITDLRAPRQVAAVQTCRGSHTHTLVNDPGNAGSLYLYASGTGSVRSGEELAGCSEAEPQDDPDTALFSIDVIEVPLAAPETARIVSRPRIFADEATGAIAGLWQGGDHGPGSQTSRRTNQCHDITTFPEAGLAAGACSGNGILLDISDPVNPRRLDAVVDRNFAYWHSATFNNDGTKVLFTDEWGGGTSPRCRSTDLPEWGADAIFDIVDGKLQFRAYYKVPAPQTEQENCVAHNGSLIPVPGRDIMVQAWYQGGVSVFDFTDSANPVEIAFFDRGPLDAEQLIIGGYWSTYWYDGHIYGSEISRGLDVFRLTPSEHLSRNEIDAAIAARVDVFNVQQQRRLTWPATAVVARAYLDQLQRSGAMSAAQADGVNAALARGGEGQAGAPGELMALAAQLQLDATAAAGRDAARLRALVETLSGLAAAPR